MRKFIFTATYNYNLQKKQEKILHYFNGIR